MSIIIHSVVFLLRALKHLKKSEYHPRLTF